jgi:molybdopterin molybdotransferase
MVPPGTEAIIAREQLREGDARISVPSDLVVRPGQHIRRAGENAAAGTILATEGTPITAPVLAAIGACGMITVSVYKQVRVGLLVTGGEVRRTDEAPAPWCLRDANGPALTGLLAPLPWATVAPIVQVADEPAALATDMAALLAECDALLVTGGVSAGDYDYVPETIRRLGHRTVFHHLAIRPGKPVLGALTADGRPILALPGNPVSAMVTARLLALPALAWRAGRRGSVAAELVSVTDDTTAPARLTWYPLVRVTAPGQAEVVNGMGSGDWVAAAASDGFIEVPPGAAASGLRRLYRWTP